MTVEGLYKTRCVKIDGPCRTAGDHELATLNRVYGFNENGLHSSIGYLAPIENETEGYRENDLQLQPVLEEFAALNPGAIHTTTFMHTAYAG